MAYQMIVYFAVYLALTAILYTLCPQTKRYIVLLSTSLLAYTIYNKAVAIFLLATIITTHFFAIIIEKQGSKIKLSEFPKSERKIIKNKIKKKKRFFVFIYCFINIGILLTLKYFNFFSHSGVSLLNKFGFELSSPVIKIMLPLGISYYTLQALSYIIDVLRNKYKAERNILKTALFISFFPQLYEGPFGRYDELMPQLSEGKNITTQSLYSGILKFLWGGFKIFIVANRAAILANDIFNNHESYANIIVIGGIIAFTIQLYAEFSGYIDIANGISEVFGISLAQNFDLPFISQNVGEFWRRWHISLGGWFRDYIFYPISTSKPITHTLGKIKNINLSNTLTIALALFAVWFLTGLWHGASTKYIVYGLYYYVLMIIYNIFSPLFDRFYKKHNIEKDNKILTLLRIVKTLILVNLGMLIFRADNLSLALQMFISIFKGNSAIPDIHNLMGYKDFTILLLSFIVLVFSGYLKTKGKTSVILQKYNSLSPYIKYWICFCSLIAIIVFGAYGLGYVPSNPIYGGF